MKIGFDAKRAFHNFTGLGNYSRTLLQTLATYSPNDELHLFSPKQNDAPRIKSLTDTPSVYCHFPTGFWRKMHPIWRSYGISDAIAASGVQVFHGLSNELPLKLPPKVAAIVTIHDLIFERYPQFYPRFDRFVYRQKFRRACQQADVVVAISEQTKRDIIDFYKIQESKIQVIYQSCDRQFYLQNKPNETRKKNVLMQYNLPENFFLYVGTVNERKNLLGIMKALKQLKQPIKLVVIGNGGAYLKQVKDYVSANNLTHQIYWLSQINFADLPAIYAAAKALILPSFFEGFGIPVIEALWVGTPVITSVDSCLAEAGGDGALYVNPSDSEAIGAAILKINGDERLRNDLILRGGNHVQKFHERVIAQQWGNLYGKIM
ncbi:MAG: glycosyltransferase family 1 protein [Saprospiraceae bacterium]|nr:glycosyltransferase family 1 protein [Saprospiraceae bacterium]